MLKIMAQPKFGGSSKHGHSDWVLAARFHPNGKTIASGGHDCNINFWETRGKQGESHIHAIPNAHPEPVLCLDYTPEGDVLASGGKGGIIKLWDTKTYQCIRELYGHKGEVRYVRFSDDGCWLGSVGYDGTVRLWIFDSEPDTEERGIPIEEIRQLAVMTGHKKGSLLRCCAWTPDSKILASSGDDKTIRFWSVPDGKCVEVFTGHEDKVFAVAFSPDNKTMVSGSYDDTVKLWNYKTKTCLTTIPMGTHILSCDFDNDGKYFVAVGNRNLLNVFSVETLTRVARLSGHTDSCFGVDFSPVEDLMVSGSHDKTVRVWDLDAAIAEYGMSAAEKAALVANHGAAAEADGSSTPKSPQSSSPKAANRSTERNTTAKPSSPRSPRSPRSAAPTQEAAWAERLRSEASGGDSLQTHSHIHTHDRNDP